MTKDEALKMCLEYIETNAQGSKFAILIKEALAQPEPCGGCKGSGWVTRDPDIGTDQECFVCGGSGAYPKEPEHGWTPERIAGMARLKEAQDKKLAQPEQEPVGEIVDAIEGAFKCSFTKMLPVGTKLYTTPPQRKPLSDEEIETYRHMIDWTAEWSYINFARAIEAAHGIKGEA